MALGFLVCAIAASAMAQEAIGPPLGVPQDWSHRHVIHSNPDTLQEAAAKGTLDQWTKKADDPRFVLQLEKKVANLQKAAEADDETELVTDGRGARKFALATETAAAKEKKKTAPQSEPALHRDWSNVMAALRAPVARAITRPNSASSRRRRTASTISRFSRPPQEARRARAPSTARLEHLPACRLRDKRSLSRTTSMLRCRCLR
jgi:hypothetical protein